MFSQGLFVDPALTAHHHAVGFNIDKKKIPSRYKNLSKHMSALVCHVFCYHMTYPLMTVEPLIVTLPIHVAQMSQIHATCVCHIQCASSHETV